MARRTSSDEDTRKFDLSVPLEVPEPAPVEPVAGESEPVTSFPAPAPLLATEFAERRADTQQMRAFLHVERLEHGRGLRRLPESEWDEAYRAFLGAPRV